MPPHSLDPDTLLCVELSGIMSRDRYTRDPGPVIARLRQVAAVLCVRVLKAPCVKRSWPRGSP